MPSQTEGDTPDISGMGDSQARFKLFRDYWGSRSVAARIIAARPDLVRAVLGSQHSSSPAQLANFIREKVIVLMADKDATLTLQYWDAEPKLATEFLAVAITETDRAVASSAAAMAREAADISRIGVEQAHDLAARRVLLNYAAAKDLQAAFDRQGENSSFDYVERAHVSYVDVSPRPSVAMPFALLLAVLTAFMVDTIRQLLRLPAWRPLAEAV
jgi:hypothetical protein